ncbi:AMP-binding protein [Sphingosinicella rhizophila]|uniref:AMP-binding protein n=1 Tax=Sphingosinicella rhizophila TaxID=3050082 RepID=A0ABU3QAG9_9SPHN|nr:AMP-binding protein [Sphingosinicella sp. GR2756]MDT9600287.1 AMP-binding protein [Sphingosinicella sp. GR2756]
MKHRRHAGQKEAKVTQIEESYVCGASQAPLLYKTIGRALDEAAAAHGDAEALIVLHQGIRWTYGELKMRTDRLAAGLLALGLLPGDRVGIWAPNGAEWVLTQLATAKAGLILVSLNPAYRTSEIAHALNLVGVRALVIAERFKTSDYVAMLAEVAPELERERETRLSLGALPALEWIIQIGRPRLRSMIDFASIADAETPEGLEALRLQEARNSPDDPVNIQFTSGTTGLPKGATLTHHNILNNGYFVGELMGFGAGDRLCIPVPLYHCFGMVMAVLNCVTHGAAMVFPADSFDPAAVLRAVEAERCTALFGVPTMFIAELAEADFAQFDLTSLRTGVMAGAPCPEPVMRRVMGEMHMRDVAICYGMTETSPVSFQTRRDSGLQARVGSVGTVHPFIEAKVVGEDGAILKRGETGELLVRGYSVMRGYWAQADATEAAIDQAGWMHTGDLATISTSGEARIVGRLKDMIIRGGENVYPAEIENFLIQHPDIIDVAVFGIEDEKYGEAVCAWLRTSRPLDIEDIREHCRGKIAHYKIPAVIRCVESFPMTVTGKIRKVEMREMMAEEATQD